MQQQKGGSVPSNPFGRCRSEVLQSFDRGASWHLHLRICGGPAKQCEMAHHSVCLRHRFDTYVSSAENSKRELPLAFLLHRMWDDVVGVPEATTGLKSVAI